MKRRPALVLRLSALLVALGAVIWFSFPEARTRFFTSLHRPSFSPKPISEATRDRLMRAETFELLSLDPLVRAPGERKTGFFHGFKVVGSAPVPSENLRERLVTTLYRSSRDAKYGDDYSACFEPEHALRIRDGASVMDFMICLHCGQGYFYGDVDSSVCRFDSSSAKSDLKIFDDTLDELSIPRAGRPNR